MYGLVNKALQGMVEAKAGRDAWRRICERAELRDLLFVWNEPYDDAITYRLVAAAADELGEPGEKVLEDFGIYWVLHTAQETYGALMMAGGRSLPDFLRYLPQFHDRIILLLPELRMPEFEILEEFENGLVLGYRSSREGLQPFVRGLILGLGRLFRSPVEVSLRAGRHGGLDHDEFVIRWGRAD